LPEGEDASSLAWLGWREWPWLAMFRLISHVRDPAIA
jgi:hypothetical protein